MPGTSGLGTHVMAMSAGSRSVNDSEQWEIVVRSFNPEDLLWAFQLV